MAKDYVAVEGLNRYVRGLKEMDRDLGKAMRIALNEAAQLVVDEARPHVARRSGAAARSMRASSTQSKARVSAGGRRAEYYPWLDFGGRVGRKNSVKRRFIKGGRYIYPALARVLPEAGEIVKRALVDVGRRAGLEVE